MITTATRTTFSSVNLLPPETRERQETRRKTGFVVAAGVAVLAVLGFFYFMQGTKVSQLQEKVAAENTRIATLGVEVTKLQPYQQLQESLTSRQTVLDAALGGDISWSNVLHELSAAVPPDAWLMSVSATSTQGTAAAAIPVAPVTTAPTGIVGSMTFEGSAMDTDTLSSFLIRLAREPGWVNAWMSSAQRTAIGSTPVWSFSSSVDLTSDVLSKRGGGAK